MADPLDMTLRELLECLSPQPEHEWINVRTDDLPWRQLVAAAERGEVTVSRVGRKLMMRRRDLDRWLEAQAIEAPAPKAKPVPESSKVAHLLRAKGYG